MITCHDPRHAVPCPDVERCTACQEKCSPEHWFEADGTPWGAAGLRLFERAKLAARAAGIAVDL